MELSELGTRRWNSTKAVPFASTERLKTTTVAAPMNGNQDFLNKGRKEKLTIGALAAVALEHSKIPPTDLPQS